MGKIKALLTTTLIVLAMQGCKEFAINEYGCADISSESASLQLQNSTLSQGIHGKVRYFTGDFMPTVVDEVSATNCQVISKSNWQVTPALRTIYIFEKLLISDIEPLEGSSLIKNIRGKLVATTQTDSSGYYEANLPPGEYHVATLETGGYYFANSAVVSVSANQSAQYNIDITYNATF